MGTITKTQGRKSKMNHLPILKHSPDIFKIYMSVPEKSRETGFTAQTIHNWIKKGKIEGFKLDGLIYVKRELLLPPGKLSRIVSNKL